MNDYIHTTLLGINTLIIIWLLFKVTNTPSAKKQTQNGIVLDSCALIDGRIKEIIEIGFVDGSIIVPKFVLRELQMLADGSDNHKRARARHGLEIAEELRQSHAQRFIVDESITTADKTDEQLIQLAKNRGAKLCTTDYNLNKVAAVEGIVVLNVNELSRALRPTYLPGEEQEVKLLQKGEGRGQAVGYFEDGTMVVVDNAQKLIGSRQVVIIERSLQTVAGKMSFAHLKSTKKK